MSEYKVLLAGDGGVGKSSIVNMLKWGSYDRSYYPTMGSVDTIIVFNTTIGQVKLDMCDMTGQEKFRNMQRDILNSDGAILIYDFTSRLSYKNLKWWRQIIINSHPGIPMIVGGNKTDIKERKNMDNLEQSPCEHFELSVRANRGIKDIFLNLIRKMEKNPNINWVE